MTDSAPITAGTVPAARPAGTAGTADGANSAVRAKRLREVFELALTIRLFEERLEKLFASNQIRGSVHLGIGQEAVAVGARLAARGGDIVVPTYRGHAWALAWGMALEQAFGEAHTYRFCGHMPGDTQPYRTREELAAWRERDPVTLLAARLADEGLPAADVEESARRVASRVAAAEQAAQSAPAPGPATVGLGAEPYQVSSR
jgi:TPP-dependent pyruvate/acetoin dehydrogenase alpha subunit